MLRILCVGALLIFVAPSPATAQASSPRHLKALETWLKHWRKGKLALAGPQAERSLGANAISVRMKVLPVHMLVKLTAQRELELLVGEVVKLQSADAAQRLLEVAAAGLDRTRYTPQMAPRVVRTIGEEGIARLKSDLARQHILVVARAEIRGGSNQDRTVAIRAAAIRALGLFASEAFRPALEEQLLADDERLRVAAAEGLWRMAAAQSAEPLVQLIGREQHHEVLAAAVGALREILKRHRDEIATPVLQRSVQNSIEALGRGSWRSDMVLVGFLEEFRHRETIPALINVLKRFVDHPEEIRSGATSGLLRHRAHETLISLTGALFPIDRPDQWLDFWEREQQAFELAPASDVEAKKGGTVSSGFFGIPVQGTRVLFVVDLSGSMDFQMRFDPASTEIPDRLPTRLDRAKEELVRATKGLPAMASFNLVSFNGDPTAKPWNKSLVEATEPNKKRFIKFVEAMSAGGGTNTWAGIERALASKSFDYDKRHEVDIDEMFVLSDGDPSVGEVIDAREILSLVAEANRFAKIRINTVFIADVLDESERFEQAEGAMSGEEFMRLLAEQNGGRAVKL